MVPGQVVVGAEVVKVVEAGIAVDDVAGLVLGIVLVSTGTSEVVVPGQSVVGADVVKVVEVGATVVGRCVVVGCGAVVGGSVVGAGGVHPPQPAYHQ